MSVCAVVGGQFGSEGKGLIVAHIAGAYTHHVRVGAANAGHTFYDGDGQKRVMQQLPCAAYANPFAQLWIGPGALISPDILERELDDLQAWRSVKNLDPILIHVDARAHVITQEHIDREQESDLAERIGSTSTIAKEGIGAAQAARVMREEGCVTAEAFFSEVDFWGGQIWLRDVPDALFRSAILPGNHVLLEGTQGASLSLTTGVHPFITSRNTTVPGLLADCGVAPKHLTRSIMVCRTYPIRVAGPSGPFWAGREIKWEDINVDPESERTTVTKKIRRVAEFSYGQVEESATLNGPTEVALTFCDYVEPAMAGAEGNLMDGSAPVKIGELVRNIERVSHAPVTMLGTGPKTVLRYLKEM